MEIPVQLSWELNTQVFNSIISNHGFIIYAACIGGVLGVSE